MLTDASTDWQNWKRLLERYLSVNGITDDEEKFNLLLLLGSTELESLYDRILKFDVKISDPSNPSAQIIQRYNSAIVTFDNYFTPKSNKRFERHKLRALKQAEDERFSEFVNRVHAQVSKCEYPDMYDAAIDQIVEGCQSHELRTNLLKKEMQFDEVFKLGNTLEQVKAQAKDYGNKEANLIAAVHQNNQQSVIVCTNCAWEGHRAEEKDQCPARNEECHECEKIGHYARCCALRKGKRKSSWQPNRAGQPNRSFGYRNKRPHNSNEDIPPPKRRRTADEYKNKKVYCVSRTEQATLAFEVGGVRCELLVDSGSAANIITKRTFEELQHGKAKVLMNERNYTENLNLRAYGTDAPLKFCAAFETEIKIPGKSVKD